MFRTPCIIHFKALFNSSVSYLYTEQIGSVIHHSLHVRYEPAGIIYTVIAVIIVNEE